MARRKEAFDEIGQLYHDARPPYPEPLIAHLVDTCGIDSDASVLEIGPGSGQLTLPLAERGARITAIELGPQLARLARQHVGRSGSVDIIVADFDRWTPPKSFFDVVVAATAFHWLDPSSRVARCAAALRPGGKLAVIHTNWGVRQGVDPFFDASQACYKTWDPDHDPAFAPPELDDLAEEIPEIADSPLFGPVSHRRYRVVRTYSASQYIALLSTFSNVRGFPEGARTGFTACIRRLIDAEFGGSIERTDAYDLWVSEHLATSIDERPVSASPTNRRVGDEV